MGNHEIKNGKDATISALRSDGIIVLDDETVKLPNGIAVSGTTGWPSSHRCPPAMSDGIDPQAFAILAAHDPDFVESADDDGTLDRYDLVLSGHTHGGQITVFGRAPYNVSRYGMRYLTGETEKNGVPVVISNGAGFGGLFLHVRVGAPSDYLVITLRKGTQTSAKP
jgi:predicted MPP superfamily phosphohydrolase